MKKICKECGTPLPTSFGDRVRLARVRLGLKQNELAEIINVKRTTIVNIEKGRQRATITALILLSKKLGVSSDWLLGINQ